MICLKLGDNMVESQFNIHFTNNQKNYLYNTKNSGLLEIEKPLEELIGSEFEDFLIKEGFLVENSSKEIFDIINSSNNILEEKLQVIDITILLTKKCNFQCIYCYQDREAINLTFEKSEIILKEIELLILDGVKKINIHYFGGEPLLNIEQLIYIHHCMKKLEIIYGIKYSSFLTTNGSLLNKEILNKIDFDIIQLTFDGYKETHEKYKVSKKFTYNALLYKILDILNFSESKIRIRFNICKNNANDFEDVIRDIFNLEGINIQRIDFHFNFMHKFDDKSYFTELTIKEFSGIDWKLRKQLQSYGIKLKLPKPISISCKFSFKLAVCLSPNLETHYCSSSEELVSNSNSPMKFFSDKKPKLSLPQICCECKVLPLCMYHCRLFKNPEDVCITEKFHLIDMLKNYINNPNNWTS